MLKNEQKINKKLKTRKMVAKFLSNYSLELMDLKFKLKHSKLFTSKKIIKQKIIDRQRIVKELKEIENRI